MATPRVTIDQLPEQTTPEDANYFVIQDTGVSKKMSYATLKAQASTPLTNHVNSATDAHDASAISATSSGTGVDGTTVQGQLGQLTTLVNGKISQTVADGLYVNISGDTLTGPLVLVSDPLNALEAATKQYVDQAVIDAGGGITQPDADARYVNIDGDTMTGPLVVSALISTNTGLVLPVGEPSALDRACRKDYVDTAITNSLVPYMPKSGGPFSGLVSYAAGITPTSGNHLTDKEYVDGGLDQRVAIGGDTMVGTLNINMGALATCIVLRNDANAPLLAFNDSTNTTRKAYLQAGTSAVRLSSDDAAIPVIFRCGAADVLTVGNATIRASKLMNCEGQVRSAHGSLVWGNGSSYYAFYAAATDVDTLGPRAGYIGRSGAAFYVQSEEANIPMSLRTDGRMSFFTNGVEAGSFDTTQNFNVGKTSADLTLQGASLTSTGRLYVVTPSATSYNIISNITNGVAGDVHVAWRRANVAIGSVTQVGTTGIAYNTTSDGRFKHELGEISDAEALERVMAYRPVKYQWLLDVNDSPSMYGTPGGNVEWGMIAQEAIEVNNVAVSPGRKEPNEVDFSPMAMDYGRITPELVAAIKALVHRVEALEGAAA